MPPRTWVRRLIGPLVVLVVAGTLLPFTVEAVFVTANARNTYDAVIFGGISVMLLFAVGASLFEGIRATVTPPEQKKGGTTVGLALRRLLALSRVSRQRF
ncbi:hypothetical protein [Microbacterium caowuchunii]|uniref:Uncharacterized protein n=1 Tax=Microbacterium caowuchunii TaxID=2614638 RepID=A0A5N0TP30_9MICO|nr:hypothetical protein [Microbacterium caowuchunii]KAA9135149.1 hypothetical protein F6B40_05615 [Microbacterium caowuchunii]